MNKSFLISMLFLLSSVTICAQTTVSRGVPKDGHYMVDLGLSVKWATCNVGADYPEEYGRLFSWGETQPKQNYDEKTYKYYQKKMFSEGEYTKYNNSDGKRRLEKSDDCASVQWGGAWRMPTLNEAEELIEKCRWEKCSINGISGTKVIGPNGNSIFIPYAGRSYDKNLIESGEAGFFWTSSLSDFETAIGIRIEYKGGRYNVGRTCGHSIRPVCP